MFFRGQIIGKYKILSTIGSGGFGTVYLAEDTWIDKKVALKVPHKQGLDFGELLREPRLLATLNHPNIVTILTAEKQENVFFIVMEFVPGETLESIIASEGALDLPRALDYTCQICNAVDHAHRQGVLHRDLRPSNVIVADSGLLKVADFGTSRFLEIAAHGTTVIGSPPYMAPEQFQGKAVFASDIYSLGVTMFQMLTGAAAVRHAVTRRPRSAAARANCSRRPRLKNPKSPEGDQRHRAEGDGARHPRPLSARRRSARRRAGRADAAAHGGRPSPVAVRRRRSARDPARLQRPGDPASRASAGTAANRSTRARTSARSAESPVAHSGACSSRRHEDDTKLTKRFAGQESLTICLQTVERMRPQRSQSVCKRRSQARAAAKRRLRTRPGTRNTRRSAPWSLNQSPWISGRPRPRAPGRPGVAGSPRDCRCSGGVTSAQSRQAGASLQCRLCVILCGLCGSAVDVVAGRHPQLASVRRPTERQSALLQLPQLPVPDARIDLRSYDHGRVSGDRARSG